MKEIFCQFAQRFSPLCPPFCTRKNSVERILIKLSDLNVFTAVEYEYIVSASIPSVCTRDSFGSIHADDGVLAGS